MIMNIEYDAENWNSDDEDTEGAFVSSEDTCEIHPNVQDKVRQVWSVPGLKVLVLLDFCVCVWTKL